jgi:hypothetical protein
MYAYACLTFCLLLTLDILLRVVVHCYLLRARGSLCSWLALPLTLCVLPHSVGRGYRVCCRAGVSSPFR